ncbi:hypothetical protein EDB84DRAFT_1564554 [Lactarius hengduanensis]|nr:hypothetical protein EDB84DRAFT_1564554 [Lactarius hengduanensis]
MADDAALVASLEDADNDSTTPHGVKTTLHVDAATALILSGPSSLEDTPSPDSIFDKKAEALYHAWVVLLGQMNPKNFEKLQREYSANPVGNTHVWLLSCWLHRAPPARVLSFLRTHSPSTGVIESIQHAFETRLSRLRGQLADHGKHAAAVRTAIAEWKGGAHHAPTPDLLPTPGLSTMEAMREAVPSPSPQPATGGQSNPISIRSGDSNGSVELILPLNLTAFERAKRRASRAPSSARPPSRLPSISLQDLAEAAFDPDKDEPMKGEGSDSSTTPTTLTPSSPWPHTIPKKDWPVEWGSHTPSEHSSVNRLVGEHPRRPITVDTPTPDAPSGPSPSPPTDMGRPDPAGRMTARGQAPRPLSPMEVVWGASTQTQAARTVLNELRDLSRQPLPTSAEISEVHAASIDEAAEWANIWADTIAPLREGYSRYTLREPIPLIKGGNRIEPAHALDTAFKVVVAALGAGFDKPGTPQDRTLASNHWFRGASAVLASTIRGMLVSQCFFDQGSWPIEPCLDDFKVESDLENPSNQLELLRSMTEQLLSELTVQGEDRLNREDLWNSIKEQEISMLRDAMGKAAERECAQWEAELVDSLKGKAIDRALAGLIEDLEAEDSPHASGIALAKSTLDRVMSEAGKPGVKPVPPSQIAKWQNQFVAETHEELRAAALAQAEREWQSWRETQFAKASGEAMRRLSIDYIIEKCGPDAQAIIAEKQNFAKEYAHSNYQNWLDQVLTERWPSVEADAQAFSREDYFNRELAAIYPEVHQEAHDAAKKEALQAAALFKERLTNQKCAAASKEHDGDLYRASIKATTLKKVTDSQKVDARRTNLADVLDNLNYDSPEEGLITHDHLTALVESESNMNTDEPPNAAFKLGAAMGLVEPFEGLVPQVRPHLGFAPSPETIGKPSPSPTLPIMVALPTVNEEVAATRTIHSSAHAGEAEPSPPPLRLQGTISSTDTLRLQRNITTPALGGHGGDPPGACAPSPAPRWHCRPLKGGRSPPPAPKGLTGRSNPKTSVAQNPVPLSPWPPLQEATTGARTMEVSPSPPSAGARTDPAATPPSIPAAPLLPRPNPNRKGVHVRPQTMTGSSRSPGLSHHRRGSTTTHRSRSPPTRSVPVPRNTTRVVVARHGGFSDTTKEATLRGDLPERIAASVRSAIERSTSNPIKILSGHPMEWILQFSKFLLQPFPGGTLIPAEGWCWAQLREVLVHDDDNTVRTEESLFEEITRNPVFDGIPFVQRPHWERDVMRIDTATATVIFAYIDPAGKVAKEAKSTGIFMYNYGAKFVFSGDTPPPKQCGRCFLIGHVTNAPECRWNGKNRCVRCGLDHHHDDHNTSCPATTHKSADRGDFPPPRAAPRLINEDGDEQEPPAPARPKSILKRPTEIPSSSPPPARRPTRPGPPGTKDHQPKARIVLPTTDTAKPNETSMERAATRHHEVPIPAPPAPKPTSAAGPAPVEDFPALPAAIPNTAYDHATRVHIEDRAHQLLTEAVENVAIVQVGDFFYRCPLNEMNIPFRRLRDREMLILNKMRYGDSLGPEDKFNFTAKYEREARKSRAFGNFDLHGNPTTEDLFPSAILTPTKPVLPL